VVCALSSIPAQATTQYFTHYDVTLNGGQSDVTNMMLLETQNGLTWSFSTGCGGGGGCTTEIDNPFGSTNAPTTALLFGLTNNGQDVVLMTSNAFAAGAVGEDWSTLFPDVAESDLLADIQLGTSADRSARRLRGQRCPASTQAWMECSTLAAETEPARISTLATRSAFWNFQTACRSAREPRG